ncbi:MAG: hypothetical protein O3A00_26600, partial [Planctomycetota bacterium]|nr:hypothetical protein [Planctomycetota bacterium]
MGIVLGPGLKAEITAASPQFIAALHALQCPPQNQYGRTKVLPFLGVKAETCCRTGTPLLPVD